MFKSLSGVHFPAALSFLRFRSLETIKLTQLTFEKNQETEKTKQNKTKKP